MTHHSTSDSLDLLAIAHQAMIDEGFVPDLPQSVSDQLKVIESRNQSSPPPDNAVRDLSALLWSSIDNSQSRDLDQVEYAESLPNGDVRVRIGIADVDALVDVHSAIDAYAAENSTSVYTGIKTFSMLPEELSTDMTSLVGGADRSSIVIDMVLANDGTVKAIDVYRARIHNFAKLSYEAVGIWLEQEGEIPAAVTSVPGMDKQIRLQLETAMRLRELRKQHGALELETIQATPVLNDAGQITDLAVTKHNSARDIIENFMIAANVAMAQFLEARGVMSLRRVVRTPKQWPRIVEVAQALGEQLPESADSRALADFLSRRRVADPVQFPELSLSIVKLLGPGEYVVKKPGSAGDGHFGLAVHDYTHSTAPNRRYADLVTQRLVKAALTNAPAPYTEEELGNIATHCTEREDAARKVERKMRKVAAAVLLEPRIGEEFDAIVTGVTPKGTFARLIKPPVDGRVMRGEYGLRVGEKVRVRLLSTDPRRGFIDFARIGDR
jgi:VacB/RNase II family 3'-5' exoribonuclease